MMKYDMKNSIREETSTKTNMHSRIDEDLNY